MTHDQALAERIRSLLADRSGVTERRMFGGLAFLVEGRLAAGAGAGGQLLVAVLPSRLDVLLEDARAVRAVMGTRLMKGWLRVDTTGLDDPGLGRWVAEGVAAARARQPS